MYAFGVDIGGTGIKSGIVDDGGKIIIKASIPTDRSFDYRVIVSDIAAQLKSLCKESGIALGDIAGVGIGCPGAVNSRRGTVDYANYVFWREVALLVSLV